MALEGKFGRTYSKRPPLDVWNNAKSSSSYPTYKDKQTWLYLPDLGHKGSLRILHYRFQLCLPIFKPIIANYIPCKS